MYKTVVRIFLIFLFSYLFVLLGSILVFVIFTDVEIDRNVFLTLLYKSLFFAIPIGILSLISIGKKRVASNFKKDE